MEKKSTYKPNRAMSVVEFLKKFPNEDAAKKYLEEKRWNEKPYCPHCGSFNVAFWRIISRTNYYNCKDCKSPFNVKTGTIFAKTLIPLQTWFLAFYFIVTTRKGISSIQLSEALGITQKTAWALGHRIRRAMENGEFDKPLKGVIEVDETYIGGKEKNKHFDKKTKGAQGGSGKVPVLGIVERGGNLYAKIIPDNKKATIQNIIAQKVEQGSIVNTDGAKQYNDIENLGYKKESVNHSRKIYVRKNSHTNTIESAWALLKRGIYGVSHKYSVKYLQKYLDEFVFRWNECKRGYGTMDMIDKLLGRCWIKRIY
jgi:transposase-like protein